MDINKFTQKSQEGLQDAQNKAVRFGHNEVDIDHLLLSLIDQEGGIVPRLLQKMDVKPEAFKDEVQKEVQKRASVSGPGAEPGKVFVTQRMNKVLVKAEEEAKRLKDEYVSVEHLMLA